MTVESYQLPRMPEGEDSLNELVRRISSIGVEGLSPKGRLVLMKERYDLPEEVREQIVGRLSEHYKIPTGRIGKFDSIDELKAALLLEYFGLSIPDVKKERDEFDWNQIEKLVGLPFYAPRFPEFVDGCIGAAVRFHALETLKKELAQVLAIIDMSADQVDASRGRQRHSRFGLVNEILRQVRQANEAIDSRIPCPILFVKRDDYKLRDIVDEMFGNFQTTQQLISNTRIAKSSPFILKQTYLSLEDMLEPIED